LGYDFEIVYKKGKQNVVADALSRKDEDVEAFLCAISIIQPDWIIEARDEWKNDEKVWTLIQRLQQDSSASDTFSWKNDSLWYKDRLYFCKNFQLKQKVLLELHTSPVMQTPRPSGQHPPRIVLKLPLSQIDSLISPQGILHTHK
jgi:hypothetical protein